MKEVIFITAIITLAGVGISTLICYVWDKCIEIRRFSKELNVFIQSRKQGKRVIEIKVAKSALIPEPAPTEPIKEVKQAPQEEEPQAEEPHAEQPKAEPQPQALAPKEEKSTSDDYMESLFIALEFEGEDYTSSHTISADDLGHLARVLGSDDSSIRDEARAVNTLLRLKNSPMLEQISNLTEERVKKLVTSIANNVPKIKKEGYDYSQYID